MQCNSEKSAINMGKRPSDLLELSSYIQTVDNDVTMILQSLQWDRKHLIEASAMVSCQYNQNHRVPPDKLKDHEKECHVRSLGYSKEDLLLPEPLDEKANTLVTLNKNDIANIIEYAAKIDPGFKKGMGGEPTELLSLGRLQHAYSADERRALHDAAVSAAPACHDLGELALLGGDNEAVSSKQKSRAEILAELRDMKRRRAKYRVAAKTRNYSDVLRDVIATQMEHYNEVHNGDPTYDSHDLDKSKTDKPQQHEKNQSEQDKTYLKEMETERNYRDRSIESRHRFSSGDKKRHRDDFRDQLRRKDNSRDETRHRDNSRGDTRCRDNFKDVIRRRDTSKDETHRRDNPRDETRHRDNFRDETRHTDRSREGYKDKERRHDDYKRHNPRDDERRRRDDGDKHSRSSKDRSKDKKDYRTSERYGDDYHDVKKEYKDHKSSGNGEVRYKREDDSYEKYRDHKHKRYYDYKPEEFEVHKRIKQEKD